MKGETTKEKTSILKKFGINIVLKTTQTKTVTVADIALFAGVSKDFNTVYVYEEHARETFFGDRIARGVLA